MSAHELRSSIPQTVLDLSSDERTALNQLRTELATDGSAPLQQNATDVTLYRFLRGNGGDVAKARAAVNKYAAWRVSSKTDDILSIDYDKEYHTIRQLCPYAYQGVDHDGRPIYWEKTGKIHCAGLARLIPIEMFQESHVWGMEYMAKRCQEESVATGKNVDLYCAVLDLTGLGLHHRSVIHYLKAMAEFDQTYYPEKMGKVLVLNAPWVVNVLWPMVQVFLDATTKSRIEVITGDLKEGLSKHIDIKYIPKEYGGQGDDIKEYDASEIDAESKDNLGLTLQNVGAGSTWYQERTCGPEGGAFSWTFISQGGYDIIFSIAREDTETKNSTDPVYVVEPSKVTSARGSYESKGACKLIFKFDNTYSYLTSKDIEYMLSVDPIIEQLHKK